MLYRESGLFHTSYAADQAVFPIPLDRMAIVVFAVIAVVAIPMFGNEWFLSTIMLPFLIFSLAAIGLNILTGYCGQLSLGTGGFMATGAFAAFKLSTAFPDLHIVIVLFASGLIAALVGIAFGLPSLRIKGFYLAVATLAAQFFLIWMFNKYGWFTNYSASGVISAPPREVFGDVIVTSSQASLEARYLFALAIVVVLAIAAKNMARSRIGRMWMAIRDMDIAAEIMGMRPLPTKLSAFAVSSFYCGIAGAMWAFLHTGTVEPLAFDVNRSFQILFMVIIGGLGSILGSFFGAAFIVLLPIVLNNAPGWLGYQVPTDLLSHVEFMIFGVLIVFFLIVEPAGLARLWQIGKEKLRRWPFPY